MIMWVLINNEIVTTLFLPVKRNILHMNGQNKPFSLVTLFCFIKGYSKANELNTKMLASDLK